MKLLHLSLIPLLVAPFAAIAHEYWIAPSDFTVSEGDELVLNVCEGHDFPLCEDFEFPDTFTGLFVTGPDGERHEIEVAPGDDGAAIAEWTANTPGRHAFTVQMVLTHARRGEIPLYTARAEVRVPGGEAQAPPEGLGNGLEIFVVDDLGAGEDADQVRFHVTHNGRPAQVSLQIQPEEGRSFSIQSNRDGDATLRRTTPGRYLVHTSHQGVSGAVSFRVPE